MTAQNKKLLSNLHGFTLIELMVVISIIAIISVVAISLFSNVQRDARDGKRRSELEAIANVLEVNRLQSGYQPILCTYFGGQKCPGQTLTSSTMAIDPQEYPYCISIALGQADASPIAPTAGPPAGWSVSATPATVPGSCPSGYTPIQNGAPLPPAGGIQQYKICTILENRGLYQSACRTNTQ